MEAALLQRRLGVPGAVITGLGSILGTGVFVAIGTAAGVAGPAAVPAILLAAVVALCNATSSAQLAASHPVSGGTYEYGYRYLRPALGFTAGWMFLCAKSASAATGALGFAGYLLHATGGNPGLRSSLAAGIALLVTLVVLGGIRRTATANALILSVTVVSLLLFVLAGASRAAANAGTNLLPFFGEGRATAPGFLHASALMFVAYTGYGRIATLGEEVRDPRRTIPRAILITLAISAILYAAVGITAIGAAGPEALAAATRGKAAPLAVVARDFPWPGAARGVALGAMTAMLAVLLNLILGLSRVVLAMGRRGDLPAATARLNEARTTPPVAVLGVGLVVTGLTAFGSVETTWSFSAFTVLIYYAITNLAALRLPPEDRLYPRFFAWAGLGTCLFLAFWVEPEIWAAGLGMILAGLVGHTVARRRRTS